jgi:cyclic beta-1,2-glucan synthetase
VGPHGLLQPGGAFGFRDQLQDVMALGCSARPDLYREHLLRALRGSSSKATCSTGGTPHRPRRAHALLGRPAVAALRGAQYVRPPATGELLDVAVPFLVAPLLGPGETMPTAPDDRRETGTLYEHCMRAIERSLAVGRARPAADRQRRLERRHEPRRPQGPRREHLARLVPARVLQDFASRLRRRARRRSARRALARRGERLAMLDQSLGRRVVPPRLLRRRHAAGVGAGRECRIDAISQSLGGALGRGTGTPRERAMDSVRMRTSCALRAA